MKRVAVRFLAVALAFSVGFAAVAAVETVVESFTFDGALEIPNDPNTLDIDTANYVLAENIDFHINGVRLESTERDVLKRLGKPKKVTPWESHTDLKVFHYDGLEIRLSKYMGWKVDWIEITSQSQNFRAITAGSSVEEARRVLGYPLEDNERYPEYAGEAYLEYGGMKEEFIQVWHKDGRVTRIVAGYYDC